MRQQKHFPYRRTSLLKEDVIGLCAVA